MTRTIQWTGRVRLMAAMLCAVFVVSACQYGAPDVGIPDNATAAHGAATSKVSSGLADPIVTPPGTRPPAVGAAPPLQRGSGSYLAGPGDVLDVVVFDEPDLSRRVVVGPDGRFNYPLTGSVAAGGRTLNAIETVIRAGIGRTIREPQVTVTLADLAADRVYVTGEVLSPGAFEMVDPISVMQAISMAGGFTVYARKGLIVIYNPTLGETSRRIFDYEAFLADPDAYDLALAPGDTVIVP